MEGRPITLTEHIDDIRDKLKNEQYPNEAAISDGVVLRLLCDGLNWPRYDTRIVYREYPVQGGRVDFALCHPEQKPKVLIEVKSVGKMEGGEQQLFNYAFHQGVPIIVLTDGRKWRFFYPLALGDYREREVVELDLVDDSSEKASRRLTRYLLHESVRNGEAFEAIKDDHQKAAEQRQAAKHLPEAWKKLIDDEDEFLLGALSEKTESLCGHKPTPEQMMIFLKRLETTPSSGIETVKSTASSNTSTPREPGKKRPATRLVVTIDGETIDRKTATDTFVDAIGRIGVDRVKELNKRLCGAPLVSTEKPKIQHREFGEHYIVVLSSTIQKKRILDEIAAEMNLPLKVEIVEK